MNVWSLPTTWTVGTRQYGIHADFRDILEIFSYFQNENLPEYLRWDIALALFYKEPIPPADRQAAMEGLAAFLTWGRPQKPGPRRIDWQQDAPAIVADVNKVAGQEIRNLPFVHWWTFLSWFHAVGEGQLSALVGLREKLARGKTLTPEEREFYRQNKDLVDLPKHYTAADLAQQEQLNRLLGN